MSIHPYRDQPSRAFWSRSVSKEYSPVELVNQDAPILRSDDVIVSAGSCFASNLVPYLEKAGYTYLRTEVPHPKFQDLPENLGYRNFSAAYGNIYTARQVRQLLERATGTFTPVEDRWITDAGVIDPFRPGLRFPARTPREFDALTRQHLNAVAEAFQKATVVVFTLGLTEAWESTIDGAVYPACPGTIAGTFDATRHAFHNFGVSEVVDDLRSFIQIVRQSNPKCRFVITVSPVPLVATATDQHVLVATTYSKSVLRVAASEVARLEREVVYFPAYEIVTGPQAPESFFQEDRREVSSAAVDVVMQSLLALSERGDTIHAATPAPRRLDDEPRAEAVLRDNSIAGAVDEILNAECDEMMADTDLVRARSD